MSSSQRLYCNRCRQYRSHDQFHHDRVGRPYKTCVTCRIRDREDGVTRRREPLQELHSNNFRPRRQRRAPDDVDTDERPRQRPRRRYSPIPSHLSDPSAYLRADSAPVPLDLGPMNVECDLCRALHWRDERVSTSVGEDALFELCCKRGSVSLPLYRSPPPYLSDLLQSTDPIARRFRENIRQYNSALAFTSVNYTAADRGLQPGGVTCFSIHGELYHLQGPLEPALSETPRYAQLYFYDPATAGHLRAQQNPQLDPQILQRLTDMLHTINNPFIGMYHTARERLQQQPHNGPLRAILNPQMRLVLEAGPDQRRENLPTADEVAIIIPDELADASFRDILLAERDESATSPRYSRINSTHAAYMPLHYVLLFPNGDHGWRWGLQLHDSQQIRTRIRLTERVYYRFYLHFRQHSKLVPFAYCRLFQQYIVDAWALCEQHSLNWISNHQANLRADVYNGIVDALSRIDVSFESLGRRVILPSSFLGGPRFIGQCYQDSMAIVRRYGRPSLFITFTANPKWEEITRELLPEQAAVDRPDLVARVFRLKVTHLLADLKHGEIFGRFQGCVWTIEYQKRGLPHLHLLLFLDPLYRDRLLDPAIIDRVILAELPQPEDDPDGRLTQIVRTMMIHGPCGAEFPNAPCMVSKGPNLPLTCSKRFPKQFTPVTLVGENGYPQYRRRDNGQSCTVQGRDGRQRTLDNRWVVPYNPYLSRKYGAHINVEICASVRSVKYIHKYIYKGSDRTTLRLTTNDNDEVHQYLNGRYISPAEAIWRLFEFPVHEEYPPVISLAVHLPGQQAIYFQPDHTVEEIRRRLEECHSTLTAFFQYNAEHEDGHHYLYQDFPTHYVFDKKKREWHPRQRGMAIGRMYHCSPLAGERYYLRLLLTVVRGPTSFTSLRTVNGTLSATFQSACVALGLIEGDNDWIDCFTEAIEFSTGTQLRSLFALALIYGSVTESLMLWERFKPAFCDDLAHILEQRTEISTVTAELCHDYGLFLIQRILMDHSKDLTDFQLPVVQRQWGPTTENSLLTAELAYDPVDEGALWEKSHGQLNNDQRQCFDAITAAIQEDPPNAHFFLQGPAGTGKTFLYRCICHHYRSQGKIVLCVASSGIAALLLPGGRTAHSRFRIPINLHEDSTCSITKNSHLAELLQKTALIIWDEVPMQHKHCFEAVHRTLMDIRLNDSLFGGIPAIFGGDFAQILPVVQQGNRADIVNACLQQSFLWRDLRVLALRQNMRVRERDINHKFIHWIRRLSTDRSFMGQINLLPQITRFTAEELFYDHVYPVSLLARAHINPETFSSRAILTVRNDMVSEINEFILQKLHGASTAFHSTDTADVPEDSPEFPAPELLQSFNPSSLPPSRINLKIGAPVILLRNLFPKEGLCNGTRMFVTHLGRRSIETRILGGQFHNQLRLIPRIKLSSTEGELPYVITRTQLPIRLCFAMTINKAQGQSFERVGVDLRMPVFTHGQLYVAFSRVTSVEGLSVLLPEQPGQHDNQTTENIIYPEVLLT